MADVVAVIPARSGSKSVVDKNIKLLAGHPLIAYSIAVARLSTLIEQVIVTTDSSEIAEISRQYGAEVPFLRPREISMDDSPDIDFFKHYLSFLSERKSSLPEYMVHLRPTSPLRDVNVLNKAIRLMLADKSATSMRSVYPSPISPYKVFKMDGPYLRGFYPDDPREEYYNLPRQFFPQTFIPNGYIDIVRASTIKNNTLHGDKMLGFVTEKIPDIDIAEDFTYAVNVLKENRFKDLIEYMKKIY